MRLLSPITMAVLMGQGLPEIDKICPAITPTVGSTLVNDGGMEQWDDANNAHYWPEVLSGSSTLNREATVVDAGTYAARLDVDSSNSMAQIQQSIASLAGEWFYISFKAKTSVAGKSFLGLLTSVATAAVTPGTSYISVNWVLRAAADNQYVAFRRNVAGSSSIYIDTVVVAKLDFASCLTYLGQRSKLDGSYQCAPTVAAGQAGIALGYKDASNTLLLHVDRTTGKLCLDQCNNGTWSTLASGAITYADEKAALVTISGTTAKIYYDGGQIGTDGTITATLGTKVYGFSTFASNAVGRVQTNFT